MTKRIIIHIFGLFFLAFGIAVIASTELGSQPLDAFNKFSSSIVSGVINREFTFGAMTFVTNATLAFIVLALKRDPKILICLLVSLILSLFIDFWVMGYQYVITNLIANSLLFRVVINFAGIASIVLATSILILNDLILSPYDEFILYVADKAKTYRLGRLIVDGSFLIMAIILGLILNGINNDKLFLFTQISYFTIILIILLPILINKTTDLMKKNK